VDSAAEQFGLALRQARRSKGLSQERLGELTGLHPTEISRLERAAREPRLSTIVKLARPLGITAADLLRGIR
jgi:transcriptional regulator with XRE-family HTH domain